MSSRLGTAATSRLPASYSAKAGTSSNMLQVSFVDLGLAGMFSVPSQNGFLISVMLESWIHSFRVYGP